MSIVTSRYIHEALYCHGFQFERRYFALNDARASTFDATSRLRGFSPIQEYDALACRLLQIGVGGTEPPVNGTLDRGRAHSRQ